MKIKLQPKSKELTIHKKSNSSLERPKTKKKPIMLYQPSSLLTVPAHQPHPKYISISHQNTEPKRKKTKKAPKQEAEFIKQFQEITQIYKKSKQVDNQEDLDLLCTEEDIDFRGNRNRADRNKFKSYYSISNRYSDNSSAILPSIAQKDAEQEKQEDFMVTTKKTLHRSPLSTATHNRTKNTKSAHDNYVNEFEIKTKSASRQKKMTIDVQRVIISRTKTKSSNSQRKTQKKKTK